MEACEPWVFRRNLLLSVCPAEPFPTHQLLLSAEEDTLMLCGPSGCAATAACVLCCNSQALNVLPVGWASLPCVCVHSRGAGFGKAKETVGASVVCSARDRPSCCLAGTGSDPAWLCSPCACQRLCLAPGRAKA